MNARTEILAALQRAGYDQQGSESLLGRAEVERLREAQREVVAWLVKKAGEYRSTGRQQHRLQADAIGTLASKVDRGAVRLLGMGHYRDAMDEHRAEVLREASEVCVQWDSDCTQCAVELEVAGELRRMADAAVKDTPAGGASTHAADPASYGPDRCMHGASITVECGDCDALGQIGGPA
jgi:hypothetical protein